MIFAKYYYPPVNFSSVWFSEMTLECLKKNEYNISGGDVILDVGCGLGNNCFSLLDYTPKEIFGFDISSDTIELLKTFTDKINFRKLDICKDDISGLLNKFTVIFSCDVYEHVENPQVMLDNIYSLLSPKGVVSITFPNEEEHGHNQIKNIKEFKDKLERAGFHEYNIEVVTGMSAIFRFFVSIYRITQLVTDKMYGIKRNLNKRPESDLFHEMYAYKKIQKLKKRKSLVILINIIYYIIKKISRLSDSYLHSKSFDDLRNKRIVFFARK